MAKQVIQIEVDTPDDWQLTGEYRHAVTYDHYMPEPGSIAQWLDYDPSNDAYLIARPVSATVEGVE
jgi:hypothetical protein